jgi:DNA-binding response OmpR family regulator
MCNKILIVENELAAREQIEQILQGIVEEGGELFFTHQREEALSLIKKERPQIVFLDISLIGEDRAVWAQQEGVHLILTLPSTVKPLRGEEWIVKPFQSDQVFEKCHAYLSREAMPPILPM